VHKTFFTKNEKHSRAKHLQGAAIKGGARQVPRAHQLKPTTDTNSDFDCEISRKEKKNQADSGKFLTF